jgi:hypothetical protein
MRDKEEAIGVAQPAQADVRLTFRFHAPQPPLLLL